MYFAIICTFTCHEYSYPLAMHVHSSSHCSTWQWQHTCSHRGVEAAWIPVHVSAYTQCMWCIAWIKCRCCKKVLFYNVEISRGSWPTVLLFCTSKVHVYIRTQLQKHSTQTVETGSRVLFVDITFTKLRGLDLPTSEKSCQFNARSRTFHGDFAVAVLNVALA